jgi:hypothetical protein
MPVGSRADFGLDKLDYVMFVPKALQKNKRCLQS